MCEYAHPYYEVLTIIRLRIMAASAIKAERITVLYLRDQLPFFLLHSLSSSSILFKFVPIWKPCMDQDGKRRKTAREGDRPEEEEDEETKMEEFFALAQISREIRERLIRRGAPAPESSNLREREQKAWIPRFKPEDFVDDDGPSGGCQRPPPLSNGEADPPKEDSREDEEGKQKDSNWLDLKLSL